MSAFIVSPETMQRCVTAMHHRHEPCAHADQLGRELFKLNMRAVAHRYPNDTPSTLPGMDEEMAEIWTWRVDCPLLHYDCPDDLGIACDQLKALHCLRYQLTEGDEVPATSLYGQIERRIQELEGHIVTRLPEYKAAAWDSQTPPCVEANATR